MNLQWVWVGWNKERYIYTTIHQVNRRGVPHWRVGPTLHDTLEKAKEDSAINLSDVDWTAYAVGESGIRHTVYKSQRSGHWRAYSDLAFDFSPHEEVAFAFCENQERLALAMKMGTP